MKRFKRVVVVGSVGFDQIMKLPGQFKTWLDPKKLDRLNVSFTVRTLRRECGGTGGNCAYTLGLLGSKPKIVGNLGRDGKGYRERLAAAGVDVTDLTLDSKHLSALGTVMTDDEQNQIWSFYPGPLRRMVNYGLQLTVKADDLVALLPTEPGVFKKHLKELVAVNAHFMFDPAFFIPNLSVADLIRGLKHAEIIIGNEYEIGMMRQKVNQSISDWSIGQKIVIRTLGEKGVEIWQGREHWRIPAIKALRKVDPSGAGDAFRAGFLAGYVDGKSILECGRMGALAGVWCVEHQGTQNHKFTKAEFRERLYGKN